MGEPRRTPDQVLSAAAAMDRARAAGLPDELLAVMLAARSAWWGEAPWPGRDELVPVLAHPAAPLVDLVLYRAIRNRVAPRR